MILKVEPGGCGAEKAIPDSPSTSPVERPQHGDAAEAPGQRLDRRALDVGVDRRPDVDAVARLGAGDHARARAQDAAGPAGQPLVELALEPVEADRRARRARRGARARRRARAVPGRRGRRPRRPAAPRSESRSGPLASGVPSRARMSPRVGQRRLARQLLARAQAGEHELRAPVDPRAVLLLDHREAHRAAQAAEDPCLHGDRQVVGAVVRRRVGRRSTACAASRSRRPRGRCARSASSWRACARRRRAARASRRSRRAPTRPPSCARDRRRGRLVRGPDVDPHPECDQRDRRERGEALGPRAPPPAAGGSRAGAGCG